MTKQKLRQLDGPALTAEVFRYGLAPPSTIFHQSSGQYFTEAPPARQWAAWSPHENFVQAVACFQSLRERGWATSIYWFPVTASGLVKARRFLPDTVGQSFSEVFVTEREEAYALLLVSVLAASAGEAAHG